MKETSAVLCPVDEMVNNKSVEERFTLASFTVSSADRSYVSLE